MASASPERPPVKVTYVGRKKPATGVATTTEASASDEDEPILASPKSSPSKNNKRSGSMRPPDSTATAKKIDFRTPDVPRKHGRTDSSGLHLRKSSSVSSLKLAPSSPGKHGSASKAPSSRRHGSPEDSELDDTASVAESFISLSRVRRTESERIQYFKNQAECDQAAMEPHRVKCLRCRKFVSLGQKQTYTVKPWEQHRTRCDQKVWTFPAAINDAESDAGSVTPSATASDSAVRTTEAERKAIFESDSRAAEVQTDQVLCKRCQKWIRLSKTQKYALRNWTRHQQSCSDAVPSSRITAVERKLRLINDKQVRQDSLDPRHVDCRYCGSRVALEGEGDYNLACWETHKLACTRLLHASARVEPVSGSNALPDTPVKTGTKRPLEEETEADIDTRAANRPRGEDYQAPVQEAPGPFGWFMLPLRAFVRGFRESLQHEAAS